MFQGLVVRTRGVLVLAWSVSSLAPNVARRAQGFALALFVLLRQHIPWISHRPVPLSVSKFGQHFTVYVASRADLLTIEEVLVRDIYRDPELRDPTFIVDLGSNIGASIIYFRARYPDAWILGVEPNPEIFPLLRANVRSLPRIKVLQAAVAAAPGTVDFYPAPLNYNSSTVEVTGDHSVEVPAVTLDQLIGSEPAVSLLKIDIEGAEFAVLGTNLDRVEVIAGEAHFGDATTLNETATTELLSDFDLRWVGGIDNPDGPWRRVMSFVACRRTT
jgi:FkbM family methyltransferase